MQTDVLVMVLAGAAMLAVAQIVRALPNLAAAQALMRRRGRQLRPASIHECVPVHARQTASLNDGTIYPVVHAHDASRAARRRSTPADQVANAYDDDLVVATMTARAGSGAARRTIQSADA